MLDIIGQSTTRIKTGLFLIISFLIVGYVDSFFLTWIVLGILMIISVWEASTLFDTTNKTIYTIASIVWIVASFYPRPEDLVFVVAIILASILAYTKNIDKKLFLVLAYPIISFLFLLSLYIEFGIEALLWLVFIVASADIGAYFVGKIKGKTKFCETSPNKTLEGVIGGIALASIVGLFFAPQEFSIVLNIFISAIVAISSIFGDLFESYLKREANVKDSGNILPGHGGILDRADGYLFGSVIMLVLLRLFV
jgi:phosphatidate cytidylyltransferase